MEPDVSFPNREQSLHRDPVPAAGLLERDAELAALDALIAAAPAGGKLLVLEGAAGIGKTRLLVEARRRASAAGLTVLAARGSDLEQPFSYGVVRQLFEPLLAAATAEEDTELFAGAAALARPIFDPANVGTEAGGDASLAMLHGLFWLSANIADRQAVLIAIDDLQWCDVPSLRWLLYLLTRMEGLPLLVAAGLRSGDPGSNVPLLAQLTTDPLATVVRPGVLSMQATRRLLADLITDPVDDEFGATLHAASGGNPLLVRELAGAVVAADLAPTGPNATYLQELGGRAISRAVVLRLSRLPPEAAMLARAVALLGDDADVALAADLAGLDLEATSDAAARLAGVEILHHGVPLRFVHPVVRAAVYEELSPVDKSRGHTRAARLLVGRDADPERVAGQLLATPPVGEDWATTALRAAARSALARGAPDNAATYLRRALEDASPGETGIVLAELGRVESRIAATEAPEHLAAARAAALDLRARSRIALDLGAALFTAGEARLALEVLEDALGELGDAEPELARELDYLLIGVARFEPDLYPLAVDRLERLRAMGPRLGPGDEVALANLASEAARAGLELRVAVDFAERALTTDSLMMDNPYPAFLYAVGALASAESFDAAYRHCTEAMEVAQRRGLVTQFCFASQYRSRVSLLRGSLSDAVADAHLSLDAIDLHGLEVGRRNAVAMLSHALLERGDVLAAREHVHTAELGATMETYAYTALFEVRARLRLAEGDHARALAELTELGRFLDSLGIRNPALSAWRSVAALASLGLGRRAEALRYAYEELALSRQWGSPRVLGESLIAAGLAEGGGEGLALLEEAVAVLAPSQARLEHARALVELGGALRRGNRRADAREPLRLGRELATLCGAAPLAQRAETELLATGARPRRIASSGTESLTPSERRVAEMAAAGRTNREIAQALFVTPKTVEVHLSSVYRKLELRSRRELPAALAG